ncbi:c-type cytochrome biogenesis protein CcsB [Crystallibacter degradans]|uniref:c-type cytochrome biogenesis protein CcsB n=1 Tax=Crystallibacter degradans TaxID=2726743 RepID=UPI0014750605|nr:c-type cytochrome biogenesis protein CcsB [Arthrobacter sp. SF27]NMR32399.1 c-type cytochrome biogenesis protein CcsB [Arthrobacter sp. SF27]
MTPVNETLGQYSELFMLLAALTYTVSFIAFAADLVRARKVTTAPAEPAQEPELAAAGTMGTVQWTHGSGAGKANDHKDAVVDDSMGYKALRRPAARIGVAVGILGLVVHAAGVVTRGMAAHRVPWGNMYEFTTTGAMLVMAVFLTALLFRDLRFLGTFITGLVLVMLMAGAIAFPTPVAQLIPALQSYWLIIHVSVAVLSAAIFTLTFALSVLQLAKTRQEKRGKPRTAGLLRLVPSPVSLEQLAYRLNAIGFILWTFTLMAGAIWAEAAWGRYWGWDTKEVWTFVIWVVYAGYLHARATRGWDGTRAAWLSIIGYLCVIFNFAVVNVYFPGLHSYSGL